MLEIRKIKCLSLYQISHGERKREKKDFIGIVNHNKVKFVSALVDYIIKGKEETHTRDNFKTVSVM